MTPYPPTPTPLGPAPTMEVTLAVSAQNYRLWAYTDSVIMVWNESNRFYFATMVQIAILVAIIIIFVYAAIQWIESLTEND